MGGLLAAAWSFLGSFLASLARDKSNPNPVQPNACAVLAVFLFFGTFVLNLIRMEIPKGRVPSQYDIFYVTDVVFNIANFATVIACIVLTVSIPFHTNDICGRLIYFLP